MAQVRGENRLISLVEKAKTAGQSIAQAVRNDLKIIGEARSVGMKWAEIADGLGFPGKDFEVRRAYSREKARLEKKGGVKPEASAAQVPTRTIPRVESGKNEDLDDFFKQHLIN